MLGKGVNARRGRDYAEVMCVTSKNLHHSKTGECCCGAVKEAVGSGAVHGCYGRVAATNNTRESLPMLAGLDPGSWQLSSRRLWDG